MGTGFCPSSSDQRVSPPGPAPLWASPGQGGPSRDKLTSLLSAEWSCWDMCGRRPTPGPRRGASSLVVCSTERQVCGVQARGRPQRWVWKGAWGGTSPGGAHLHQLGMEGIMHWRLGLSVCAYFGFQQRRLIKTRGVAGTWMRQGSGKALFALLAMGSSLPKVARGSGRGLRGHRCCGAHLGSRAPVPPCSPERQRWLLGSAGAPAASSPLSRDRLSGHLLPTPTLSEVPEAAGSLPGDFKV